MSTIQELFLRGRSLLKDFSQSYLEAKVLVLKSTSISEEMFFSNPSLEVSKEQEKKFYQLASKRLLGYPMAYITGEKEFWSIPFKVFPETFIPRPETELLVEKVIGLSTKKRELTFDIGTGIGNIAVVLAKELPRAQIVATDISHKALKAARLNAFLQGVSSIIFLQGNLFHPFRKSKLREKCDFIVSNPPYVSEQEWSVLQEDIRKHESKNALVAGGSGLEIIRKLIVDAPGFLKTNGYLCLEIGFHQIKEALSLFENGWKRVEHFKDLSGRPRVIIAQK